MSTYLSDYDYFLPEELIGQKPREPRDSAKLMLIDRKTGSIEHKNFYNIIDYLQKGDVLVRNADKRMASGKGVKRVRLGQLFNLKTVLGLIG